MKINGKIIADDILKYLAKEVKRQKLQPKLAVLSVKPDGQDLAFIKAKENACRKIGAKFELILYRKPPRFEEFARKIKDVSADPKINAIVIQKPLPPALNSITLYNYISPLKEIEGNKKKPLYYPPISLAVLSVINSVFNRSHSSIDRHLIKLPEDTNNLKNFFKKKTVVIIGRGETGGQPIGNTLSTLKINYISINSRTTGPTQYINNADFIISAVGKPVLSHIDIKPGVFLISVGLRKEGSIWIGDYDENKIKKIAGHYSPTPGGVGPIDIAYLMYNLVEANKNQQTRID